MLMGECAHLLADALVAAGLVSRDALGVAVHGVAHPGDNLPRALHRLHQSRHRLPQLQAKHVSVSDTQSIKSMGTQASHCAIPGQHPLEYRQSAHTRAPCV